MVLKGDGKKKYLACAKCSFKKKDVHELKISEEVKDESKPIEVVEKEVETYPVIDIDCEDCDNTKAAFWTIQTRAGDEAETKFYKCTKCKHTWRSYD